MTTLPNDIDGLRSLVKELLEKIERLESETAELRRLLGMDSSNSDKPPSSDGYRKKTLRPGLPKAGKRSNGGQEGHKGNTLKRMAEPEHRETHWPGKCRCCGRQFTPDEAQILQSRQVFELPEPKLEVTEHRLGEVECCGIWQCGEYPKEVAAPTQ